MRNAGVKGFVKMKIRKGFSLVGVAVTALAGVAVAAGPAGASSGGGCGIAGFDVVACISASGSYIEPDMYILADTNSHCTDVTFQVIDDTAGRGIFATHVGCAAGHHGPWPIAGVNGHRYHTVATMTTSTGGPQNASSSPELTFSN
jgi:hypothetical protein